MKIEITTKKLSIKIETSTNHMPFSIQNGALKDIDDYEPHLVEALLEKDPEIESVRVSNIENTWPYMDYKPKQKICKLKN